MKRMKIKEFQNILLAFVIPFLILAGAYAVFGVFPFGEKSVLICDMSEQYVDYFASLHHSVRSGESFLYSWSKALGGEMAGVYAFYLASPLSWLVVLVPLQHMPFAMMLLMLFKTALAGAAFAFYYQKVFRKSDLSAVIFAVCYALMSYNIVYGMSVMWLDGVYLLPLVLYGVEKLLKKESVRYLTVVLFICFMSNYYISYMIGLYSVLYLGCRYFSAYDARGKKEFWKCFGKLAGGAFLAAGLAACLLVPGFAALFSGKIQDEGAWLSSGTLFEWSDYLKKLLPGSYDTLKYEGTPNIYCGLLIVGMDVWFFLSGTVPKRTKLCGGALLGVMAASAYFAPLNSVWHVFREANWFPFRNSFLTSFTMILLAAMLWQKVVWKETFLRKQPVILGIVLILTSAELGANTYVQIQKMDEEFTYQSYDSYRNMILELLPLTREAESRTEGFYRLEKDFSRSKNDALSLHYRGVTHYSSDYHANLNALIRKLGMAQDYFWCGYEGSTPVTDSIFGIRYVISKEKSYHDYAAVTEAYGNVLYENPLAAGLGILTDLTVLDMELPEESYLENQNRLFEALTGETGVFKKQQLSEPVFENLTAEGNFCQRTGEGESTVEFMVQVQEDGEYYLEFPTKDTEEYELGLYLNGEYQKALYTSETKGVICLGEWKAGDVLTVTVQAYSWYFTLGEPAVYWLDREIYEKGAKILQKYSWNPENDNRTKIAATVMVEKDGVLFTTIPYEKGWTVQIDGETVPTLAVDDTLLCVEVEEGMHEIRFSYCPTGLYTGLALTTGTAAGVMAEFIRKRKRGENYETL